jgi:hypothetical protein
MQWKLKLKSAGDSAHLWKYLCESNQLWSWNIIKNGSGNWYWNRLFTLILPLTDHILIGNTMILMCHWWYYSICILSILWPVLWNTVRLIHSWWWYYYSMWYDVVTIWRRGIYSGDCWYIDILWLKWLLRMGSTFCWYRTWKPGRLYILIFCTVLVTILPLLLIPMLLVILILFSTIRPLCWSTFDWKATAFGIRWRVLLFCHWWLSNWRYSCIAVFCWLCDVVRLSVDANLFVVAWRLWWLYSIVLSDCIGEEVIPVLFQYCVVWK